MLSWKTWHQRFGHIGYTGLQKLHELGLINSLNVNTRTLKPNCIVCTKGKLTIKPFNKSAMCVKEVSELTHIDL